MAKAKNDIHTIIHIITSPAQRFFGFAPKAGLASKAPSRHSEPGGVISAGAKNLWSWLKRKTIFTRLFIS
jgi:hypothetical protein